MIASCECRDSDEEHDLWRDSQAEYWRWYFGAVLPIYTASQGDHEQMERE